MGQGPLRPLGEEPGRDGHEAHHRRMPQREVEPHAEGILSLPNQFADGGVDGRDVVDIEGMAKSERVGQEAHPEQDRVCGGRRQEGQQSEQVQPQNGPAVAEVPAPSWPSHR